MPKIEEHAENLTEAELKGETFVFGCCTNFIEITCFLANVRQCHIVYSVVHVQFYFQNIFYLF